MYASGKVEVWLTSTTFLDPAAESRKNVVLLLQPPVKKYFKQNMHCCTSSHGTAVAYRQLGHIKILEMSNGEHIKPSGWD